MENVVSFKIRLDGYSSGNSSARTDFELLKFAERIIISEYNSCDTTTVFDHGESEKSEIKLEINKDTQKFLDLIESKNIQEKLNYYFQAMIKVQ
ncbi:MAG: hypothetical protein FWE22_07090 [Firmicutes bacterium]|nr:hypothetical protein [Bacillota bacterium]